MLYFNDTKRFARIGRIQIRNVAGQRDGQHVVSLPETRDLLIFNSVAHGKFRDQRHAGHVPSLASLVTGRSQQAFTVRAPSNGVNPAAMSRVP